MTKSKIEWCDYTINPVKGLCPTACSYCYARRMYKRFKWDPEIRFDWSVANELPKIKKPSRIFWGSTMELFGDWVKEEWMRLIFEAVKRHPQHTHIFLTKQPQNLAKFSPFPDNCWVGVTATNEQMWLKAIVELWKIQAKVKYISFEPLLERLDPAIESLIKHGGISWIIIGQQTPIRPETTPKLEWAEEIATAADKAGIPVFIKNNMNCCAISDYPKLLDGQGNLRQELPREADSG